MNQVYRAGAPGLWPALQQAAQNLFQDGTEHISRELPLGELSLSLLDIEQRAREIGRPPALGDVTPSPLSSACGDSELPIGELALSNLDIGRRALQFGLGGQRHAI